MQILLRNTRITAIFLVSILLSACLTDGSDETANGFSITLTNPAGVSQIQTPDFIVSISGTVNSEAEIEVVKWANNRGGSGAANGKQNWTTGNIVLQPGFNKIVITAQDVDGVSTSEFLTVERANKPTAATAPVTTTLEWTIPTERDDQSPLTNLTGYNVYYGQRSGEYGSKIAVDGRNTTSYEVRDLSSGTWFFTVSAIDSNGLESIMSSEISRTL